MAAAWWIVLEKDKEERENKRNEISICRMRKILRNTQDPFDIPEKRFQELYR